MNRMLNNQYNKTRILTASPVGLVVIAYEGAIKSLESAKIYLLEGRYEEKEKALLNAQGIINELYSSLNMETGEISAALSSLYNYMIRKIMQADLQKNAEALDEIIGILRELKEAWETIKSEPAGSGARSFLKSDERPRMLGGIVA